MDLDDVLSTRYLTLPYKLCSRKITIESSAKIERIPPLQKKVRREFPPHPSICHGFICSRADLIYCHFPSPSFKTTLIFYVFLFLVSFLYYRLLLFFPLFFFVCLFVCLFVLKNVLFIAFILMLPCSYFTL